MQAQNVETVSTVVDANESAAILETNFGDEQPVVTVPYSSLRRSPLNVRTKPLAGIAGLAANIRAKGLRQTSSSMKSKARAENTANTVFAQASAGKPHSICCSSKSILPPSTRYPCGSLAKAKRLRFP